MKFHHLIIFVAVALLVIKMLSLMIDTQAALATKTLKPESMDVMQPYGAPHG